MRRKLIVLALVITAFASGYGVVADAYPWPWPYSRNQYRGYWEDRLDADGKYVIAVGGGCSGAYNYWNGQDNCNAVPSWIDTPGEFSSFVIDKYNNGSSTDRVGAAFIILTMIGESRTWPVSSGEIQEFINRVNAAGPYTTWNTTNFTYNLNSYNQRGTNGVGPNDIALYDDSASGHRAIVFRNSTGTVKYVIKTRCFNPIGFNTMPPLDDDQNYTITGSARIASGFSSTPNPGDTVRFEYLLGNNGPTSTSPTDIWWSAVNSRTNQAISAGNNGVMNPSAPYVIYTENYLVPIGTPPGTQICRLMDWYPLSSSNLISARSPEVCATVQSAYTLTPTINAVVSSGGAAIPGNVAEPGDSITFTYAVNNGGGISQSTTCSYRQTTWPGNNQSAPTTVFTPAGANCPPARVFPAFSPPNPSPPTATEVVPAATANTTICRSFTVTPSSNTGGTATAQSCVLVAAKPYTRLWGGDISVGSGLADSSGSCTANGNAAIVGWNKRAAGSNAGTGVQFGAFAMKRITDFASALYDPGGATSPDGLSFSNITTAIAAGDFGGDFGGSGCIPDYYATRPAAPLPIPPTVASMVTGVYGNSGTSNVSLGGGGIVNPNNRISVYVSGNVYITGNITYSGNWNTGSTPLFELIVSGNIYIDNDVTQLDGVYVAQASAVSNSGQILTCATGFSELAVNSLYANCTRKLTVNGLFVANRIQLQRTMGTLSQSNTSEASTVPYIAEVFNYGPAVWMKQPVRQTEGGTPPYDAIISLPPIL